MLGKKKKEFVFEEEMQDSGDQPEVGIAKTAKASAGKKASSTRPLLLLLLLVVVGGGGYFFMMSEPEPTPPAVPVVQRQAIPIVKPQSPATPVAPAGVTEQSTAEQPSVAAAPAAVAEQSTVEQPAVAAAPAPREEPEAAAVAPSATEPPAKVVAAVATEPSPVVTPVALPAKTPVPPPGRFTLVSPALAAKENVAKVQRTARNLGFESKVSTVSRETTMTRLRYGTFRAEEAPARLRELKNVAPGAFTMAKGDLVTVYAGSFAVQNKARTFADELYQRQILVEEEVVQVKVPLQQVTFGSFAERNAAEQAATRARAAGLEVTIQARR